MKRFKYLPVVLFALLLAGWANAGLQLDFNHPTDANYTKDTTIAIIFTVRDSNAETMDINADIYYDTAQGGQTNHILTDVNLYVSGRCTDTTFIDGSICTYNWDTTGITDANYYIDVNLYSLAPGCDAADQNFCMVEDLNNDSNSFILDKTNPTVRNDANQSWQNTDANVVTTCSDAVADVNSIAVDFNSIGYQFYTHTDRNWFIVDYDTNQQIDFFCSDMAGNTTDANTVYVFFDATGASGVVISVPVPSQAPKVVVSYSAIERSGIAKYWVSTDGTIYIDNGTNTTYEVNCAPGHSTPFYLKVNDNADNNSDVASTTVGCEEVEGPPYCGDERCDWDETAATCPKDCFAICGDGACTHTESVETCPGDCMGCGDGKCGVDESCETCPRDCGACPVEEEEEEEEEAPVEEEEEEAPPALACVSDAECNDNNPCTVDRCVAGSCSLVPVIDGTSCGYGKECRAGECTAITGIAAGIEQLTGINATVLVVSIIALIVIGYFAYAFYFKPK